MFIGTIVPGNGENDMAEIRKPKIRAGERPVLKYAEQAAKLVAEEGEETLKTLARAQHELGKKYARTRIKSRGITGKGARAAGAVYESLLRELSIEHSIIEDTNKRFVVRTSECPFMEEWKTKGADVPKLCASFGKSFVQGLCEGVNPKLRYSATKMMSKGSPYCEERIELA